MPLLFPLTILCDILYLICILEISLNCCVLNFLYNVLLGSCSNEITCKTWKYYNNLKLTSPAVVKHSDHIKFGHLMKNATV